MQDRIHFASLSSPDAGRLARLQRQLFPAELTESVAYIRSILERTEEHMVCNFSFGLFDGPQLVGYAFVYIETRSLFHNRNEDVIYIKEICLLPGYERHLKVMLDKILALREVYVPETAVEAHAVPAALAGWRKLRRYLRSHGIELSSIPEPRNPGALRPDYQLVRFDFVTRKTNRLPSPAGTATHVTRNGIEVLIVQEPAQWLAFRAVWDELLRSTGQSDLYQTFDYLWEWWRHFGIFEELHILVMKRGSTVIGFAPLYRSYASILGKGIWSIGVMGSVGSGTQSQLLFGSHAGECAEALLGYLDSVPHLWDVMNLGNCGSDTINAIRKHVAGRWQPLTLSSVALASVGLESVSAGDIDCGSIPQIQSSDSWPALEAAIDRHCEIEEREGADDSYPGISSDKAHYFFYSALAKTFASTGQITCSTLMQEGKAMASVFGIRLGASFFALQLAGDPGQAGTAALRQLLKNEAHRLKQLGVERIELAHEPAGTDQILQRSERNVIGVHHLYRNASPRFILHAGLKRIGSRWTCQLHGRGIRSLDGQSR